MKNVGLFGNVIGFMNNLLTPNFRCKWPFMFPVLGPVSCKGLILFAVFTGFSGPRSDKCIE